MLRHNLAKTVNNFQISRSCKDYIIDAHTGIKLLNFLTPGECHYSLMIMSKYKAVF